MIEQVHFFHFYPKVLAKNKIECSADLCVHYTEGLHTHDPMLYSGAFGEDEDCAKTLKGMGACAPKGISSSINAAAAAFSQG